ncbi:alpha/beta fold hydrolase [Candidatus Roizmanbacteria bacterium]|nr:alpha/beta fold hydrolase [Candidatus Roizmanbacteria bacterium]
MVVFVHGFGTQKDESYGYFVDIAKALYSVYRVVRFDFSGYGKSQGRQEDSNYGKQAGELEIILEWTRKNFGGKIYIIAQSMGTFVTALLSPHKVDKIVFTSIPNSNIEYIIECLKKRFTTRPGGVLDEKGISILPRSSGEIQKIGPIFWKVLRAFKPAEEVALLTKKTKLIILKPMQDDVVGNEFFEEYKKIPELQFIEVNGDHSFRKPEERNEVIKKIKNFLK